MTTRRRYTKVKKDIQREGKDIGVLERVYREYLTPMSAEQWARVSNLSQPSVLKQVPTRTTYYSVGGIDA